MAAGFNQAVIVGNLAHDPEISYTNSNKAVANMTVAVNRMPYNGEDAGCDFIPVVAWDKIAENCERFLRKGSKVLVSGRIQIRSYEAKDGSKRYVTEIVAGTVQFLDTRNAGDAQPSQPRRRAPEFNATPDAFPLDISELDSSAPAQGEEADIPF